MNWYFMWPPSGIESNGDFQESIFPHTAHFSIHPCPSGQQHEETFCMPFWARGIAYRQLLCRSIMWNNWKAALLYEMLLGHLSVPSSPTSVAYGWTASAASPEFGMYQPGCPHLTSFKDVSPSFRKSRLPLEEYSPKWILPIYFMTGWIMLWKCAPLLFGICIGE